MYLYIFMNISLYTLSPFPGKLEVFRGKKEFLSELSFAEHDTVPVLQGRWSKFLSSRREDFRFQVDVVHRTGLI
jgi:hypothetical protein